MAGVAFSRPLPALITLIGKRILSGWSGFFPALACPDYDDRGEDSKWLEWIFPALACPDYDDRGEDSKWLEWFFPALACPDYDDRGEDSKWLEWFFPRPCLP